MKLSICSFMWSLSTCRSADLSCWNASRSLWRVSNMKYAWSAGCDEIGHLEAIALLEGQLVSQFFRQRLFRGERAVPHDLRHSLQAVQDFLVEWCQDPLQVRVGPLRKRLRRIQVPDWEGTPAVLVVPAYPFVIASFVYLLSLVISETLLSLATKQTARKRVARMCAFSSFS